MFAPRPERVARELVRVCRRGGTIALASWNKEGFIGTMFQTIGRFIAPPGMPSPLLWGDETTVRQRFGDAVTDHYGPANRAFAALSAADQAALRDALVSLWSGANQCRDPGRTIVSSEYLEVVATRANGTSR
jgi:hypothetical protein